MKPNKYLKAARRIMPTAAVLPWLMMAASCGNSSGTIEDDRITIVTTVNNDILSVRQGESVSLIVDIDGPSGVSVAGYTVDLPEAEAKISINQNSCAANVGTSSCQEWTITPERLAIPGKYFIFIRANSPDQAANLLRTQLELQVQTNTTTITAAAAVSISGSDGVWHIRTTDEKRWSWNSNELSNNSNGSTGVGGYFKFDEQGTIIPDSVNPSSVYLASDDNSSHQWVDMTGNANQGLSLNNTGEVYSWGNNATALGYLDGSPQLLPRIVSNLTNISKVATSVSTSFALSNGEIIVWGSNLDGLHGLGNISSDEDESVIFNTVPGLSNIIDISAGQNHIIALRDDGTVWTWGINNQGQLGLDIEDIQVSVPTQITRLSNVKQISAAGNFSLALQEDGTVWSWGDNRKNQLGIGSNQNFISSPQQVTGFTRAYKIAAMFQNNESMGFVYDETTGLVWRWGEELDQPTEIPFMVAEIGPGLVIDRSCDATELPSGESARPGFIWDVRNSPVEPPKLLSFFGRNDLSCPNKLFLETGGRGTITTSPQSDGLSTGEYIGPTQVQLAVTANSGWQVDPLDPWNGNSDCDDNSVFVIGGIQCIANFIPLDSKQLTIQLAGSGNGRTTSQPSGIDCGNNCVANFSTNETITLTPLADIDSEFMGWFGDDVCDDNVSGNSAEVIMLEDATCIANFQHLTATLSVTKNGTGDGTVTSNITGIDCGADCVESFDTNTEVILTATPDSSSRFTSWTGSGDCQSPTQLVDNSATITVSQDSECIATFDLISSSDFLLTVIINGGPHAGEVNSSELPMPLMQCLNSGSEGASTTCSVPYSADSSVTLVTDIFFPNNTLSITGCDTFVGANLDCFITMDQNKTVTFDISESPEFEITATITGNGNIISFALGAEVGVTGRIECPSVNCSDTFVVPPSAPNRVIFEAHPDAGAAFVSWGVGQCDSESVNPNGIGICTIDLISGSPTTRQVDAIFQ